MSSLNQFYHNSEPVRKTGSGTTASNSPQLHPTAQKEETPTKLPTNVGVSSSPYTLPTDEAAAEICMAGGASKFQGWFKSFQDRNGNWTQPVALFDTIHKTTLGLPLNEFTVENVRERVEVSNAQFEVSDYRAKGR